MQTDAERRRGVQHKMPAKMVACHAAGRAFIAAAVMMHRAVIVLMIVGWDVRRRRLFMTLDESCCERDALDRHHERGNKKQQPAGPALHHVG